MSKKIKIDMQLAHMPIEQFKDMVAQKLGYKDSLSMIWAVVMGQLSYKDLNAVISKTIAAYSSHEVTRYKYKIKALKKKKSCFK